MTPNTHDKSRQSLNLGPIKCPRCNGQAKFEPAAVTTTEDETAISIPLKCGQCRYEWTIEIQSPSSETPLNLNSETGPQLSELENISDTDNSLARGSDRNIPGQTAERHFTDSQEFVFTRSPIFWGMIALIVVLVSLIGWLSKELQQKQINDQVTAQKETALAMSRATADAEAHKTATQQVLDRSATATAEAWLLSGVAATGTTQRRATATAEYAATLNARATLRAQQDATATAEQIITANINATTTAEFKATSTAEGMATARAEETATVQWQATATAAANVLGPKLNVVILGCDTGLDVTRGLGEVKNVWVTVQNVGDELASDVQITLSANDEEADHPDKRSPIVQLPPEYQITFKLTVDSTLGTPSTVETIATLSEGDPVSATKSACRILDETAQRLIEEAGELGVAVLIKALK